MKQVGDILDGRYILKRHLGEGPRGECWLVEEQTQQKQLWLAKLYPLTTKFWERHERVEREAELLNQLDHEMIPKFKEFFFLKEEQALCFIREWLPGKNLEQFIEDRRINEVDVRRIAIKILQGLIYTHGLSPAVLHRRLKPSNIIVGPDGKIFLTDFAPITNPLDRSENLYSFENYGYTPIEQFLGNPSQASDLYALGAILLFLLSRHHPIHLPMEKNRLQFEPYINVEPRFLRILQKLLAPEVEERFRTAKEVLTALQQCDRPSFNLTLKSSAPPNETLPTPRETLPRTSTVKIAQEEAPFEWQRNRNREMNWIWERYDTENLSGHYQPNLEPIYEALSQRYRMKNLDRFGDIVDLIDVLDTQFGFYDETGRQWIIRLLHPYDAADVLFGYYTAEFVLSRYAKELMERFSLLHTHTTDNAISQWILLYFLHKHGWTPQQLWNENEELSFHFILDKLFGDFKKTERFLQKFSQLDIGQQAKQFDRLQRQRDFIAKHYHLCVSIRPKHLPLLAESGVKNFERKAVEHYGHSWRTEWHKAFQLHRSLRRLTSWPPPLFGLANLHRSKLKKYHRLGSYVARLHQLYHDLELLSLKLQEEYHWLLPNHAKHRTLTPSTANYKALPEHEVIKKMKNKTTEEEKASESSESTGEK